MLLKANTVVFEAIKYVFRANTVVFDATKYVGKYPGSLGQIQLYLKKNTVMFSKKKNSGIQVKYIGILGGRKGGIWGQIQW